MKHLIINYKNGYHRSHIVETIDFEKYENYENILSCKVEVLIKYVKLICPYVDINKFSLMDDRRTCIRLEKLIHDEIDYLNDEADNEASFTIEIDDDRFIKCPLYLSDSENENI